MQAGMEVGDRITRVIRDKKIVPVNSLSELKAAAENAEELSVYVEDVNKKLKLLFLSCGTEDPRMPGQLDLADLLKQHKIRYVWYPTPGAHEWKVWRHALHEFGQKVFQPGS